MSILKVARMGHPVLRQVAQAVSPDLIQSPEIQQLITDLLDTVRDQDGAGLAAPQIHSSLRVVVVQLDQDFEVWINPEITPISDDLAYTFEGCLSVPDMRGLVGRPDAVEVRALDHQGQPIGYRLSGFPAVVAQHECDHLDGVLYVDKVVPKTLMFLEEYHRYADDLFDDSEFGDSEFEREPAYADELADDKLVEE